MVTAASQSLQGAVKGESLRAAGAGKQYAPRAPSGRFCAAHRFHG